jgi:hypothetical protein
MLVDYIYISIYTKKNIPGPGDICVSSSSSDCWSSSACCHPCCCRRTPTSSSRIKMEVMVVLDVLNASVVWWTVANAIWSPIVSEGCGGGLCSGRRLVQVVQGCVTVGSLSCVGGGHLLSLSFRVLFT